MHESKSPDSLGQLPKSDRNAELQRLSMAALRVALPADKFVFRDERTDDAGVDGSLELLIGSSQTNLRSQVQLKSTDSDKTNSDGSVSVQVKVSNLNYLLNGSSPIYILYVAPRNELRFAWARDERKRLDGTNQGWEQQEYVSIRFDSLLTPETINQIHERIRQEAQFQREINNILDTVSSIEPLVVSITPDTLAITDPNEAKRILLNSGTAIVSAGFIDEVKNLIRLLSPIDAREPRILLVQAHAEHVLGRYQSASAILADISLNLDKLSEDDQQFFQMLRAICDFQIGRIDNREFSERLKENLGEQDTKFARSNRLNQLNSELHSQKNWSRRDTLLGELRLLVRNIVDATDNSNAFKIHARTILMEAEGQQLTLRFIREIGESRLKVAVGRMPDLLTILRAHAELSQKWEQEAISVLKDAIAQGNPLLTANAMIVRGNFAVQFLTTRRLVEITFGTPSYILEDAIQGIVENARQAIGIFSQAGQLEGELRAKMLIADSYELIGNNDEAKSIAQEVLPTAQAMEYAALIFRAEEHLSGQGLLNKLTASTRNHSEDEKTLSSAQMTDEEISQYASQMLRVLELPAERLPILEHEYVSIRDIANEKLSWCRYIELLQDKRHELHPSTHYRTDPPRSCFCQLHRYVSRFRNSDWSVVISAFKKAYCEQCADRMPIKAE